MAFSAKWLESCGKAIAGRLPEAPTGNHNGRCILDLVSVARPRSRGGTQPPSRRHARAQQPPRLLGPRKTSPGNGPPHTQPQKTSPGTAFHQPHPRENSPSTGLPPAFPRKVRPAQPLQRLFREKLRPARHKTPISVHFEHAGRTFSRTGHSHVATMQPLTPLQPLMQASMKPPSPLQPKNAPKTPISHPQRRRRFQMRIGMGEQRRWRFQMRIGMG